MQTDFANRHKRSFTHSTLLIQPHCADQREYAFHHFSPDNDAAFAVFRPRIDDNDDPGEVERAWRTTLRNVARRAQSVQDFAEQKTSWHEIGLGYDCWGKIVDGHRREEEGEVEEEAAETRRGYMIFPGWFVPLFKFRVDCYPQEIKVQWMPMATGMLVYQEWKARMRRQWM